MRGKPVATGCGIIYREIVVSASRVVTQLRKKCIIVYHAINNSATGLPRITQTWPLPPFPPQQIMQKKKKSDLVGRQQVYSVTVRFRCSRVSPSRRDYLSLKLKNYVRVPWCETYFFFFQDLILAINKKKTRGGNSFFFSSLPPGLPLRFNFFFFCGFNVKK